MENGKVHLIGNAHLDPVWLWTWQEGYAEIKATFRSALDRLQQFPDFVFTCACAAYYEWVEQNDPDMFAEVRQRIEEGRWVIVGGWWIQPDCNVPSGESFARHSLYGQGYFREKFGRMAQVGYNVDSFGHHGMLPQLLQQSGMPYYVFMRPMQHEKQLPANLFQWESPDGSRVTTFRLSDTYCMSDNAKLKEHILLHQQMAQQAKQPYMSFYGVGNHGGGPTIANVQTIHQLQQEQEDGLASFVLSDPNRYFAEVAADGPDMPVVKDDLQHHAVGCYSAHSATKQLNRRAEHRLLSAEKFSSIAAALQRLAYPAPQLKQAWKQVMFNQFHDIMGGCSVQEAFDDARDAYGEALNIGAHALNAALQKLSWSIDTMRPEIAALSKDQHSRLWEQNDAGVPLVVFNPLSWEVTAPIHANKLLAGVTDYSGAALPMQRIRASRTDRGDKHDTLFVGTIPAFGYRVFWAYSRKEIVATGSAKAVTVSGWTLENEFVRVRLDESTGYIVEYSDKRNGAELFSTQQPGAVPIVIDETESDTWGHDLTHYRKEIGKFADAALQVVEEGPLRAVIRVTSRYGRSILRQDVTLHTHSADVHVHVRLHWIEQHAMLKLSFAPLLEQPKATWEIPYGHMERPADGKEAPGQQWVDLSGRECGLALLNDSKYAFDVLDNELRMTVVRSPLFADHFGERDGLAEFMDQGEQQFRYTLVPHAGSWQEAGVVQKAFECNVPPVTVWETYHEGPLPQSFEGIRLSVKSVVASALKRAESNDGWIVRCFETAGKPTSATIELPYLQRSWQAAFGGQQLKTFFIPDDVQSAVEETNLIEFAL